MTSAETNACRHRRKNTNALREGIEASERAMAKKAAAAAKAHHLVAEKARAARRRPEDDKGKGKAKW